MLTIVVVLLSVFLLADADEFRPRELEFFSPTGQQKNQVARQVSAKLISSILSMVVDFS